MFKKIKKLFTRRDRLKEFVERERSPKLRAFTCGYELLRTNR